MSHNLQPGAMTSHANHTNAVERFCQTITVVTIAGEEREEVCGTQLLESERNVCRSCEVCRHCQMGLGETLHFSSFDEDAVFCTKDCRESWEDNESERAAERRNEAYYGGEVVTLDEQMREARRLK